MEVFPPHTEPGPVLHPALHPALWHAHQLGRPLQGVRASGYAKLDAELPGGGWPQQALTEVLLPHAGLGELRLLAPALAAVQREQRCVIFFGPPCALNPAAWQALGLALPALVLVQGRGAAQGATPAQTSADLLWALEQALTSGQAGAVLAWLPARLPPDALRRLQLAAQNHAGPAWVLRGLEGHADALRRQPSPAPLRLALAPAGADQLQVDLFKRRGAPLAAPLRLELPPVLAPAGQRRAAARQGVAPALASAAGADTEPTAWEMQTAAPPAVTPSSTASGLARPRLR